MLICLVFLVAGPAAVWADAFDCCRDDRPEVTMQAGDGCLSPSCCVMNAPVPARRSGQEQRTKSATAQAPSANLPIAIGHPTPVVVGGGDPSPARCQTSPVLLR